MEKIAAAEDGFGQANAYYLLLWAAVAAVWLTTFYETRTIAAQVTAADRVIATYGDLAPRAMAVGEALNAVVARGPTPGDERATLAALRANSDRARALLLELAETLSDRSGVTDAARVAANSHLNRLRGLLLFNLPELQEEGLFVDGAPSLLLAETDVGTLGLPASLEALPIDDAARYLWLAGVPMRALLARADALRAAAATGDLAGALAPFADPRTGTENRRLAADLWRAWLTLEPDADAPEPELQRLAFRSLTLADPAANMLAALKEREAAQLRARGDTVMVALPVLDSKLRLSDAVLVLPWVTALLLAAIAIYLARGARYTPPKAKLGSKIVGKVPVFFAVYGAGVAGGAAVAVLLVALPWALTVWLLFLGAPGLAPGPSSLLTQGFGVGLLAGLAMLIAVIVQIVRVMTLIAEERVVRMR